MFQKSAFMETKVKFGGLDIVCNNAGIALENKWRQMVQINLVSHLNTCFCLLLE